MRILAALVLVGLYSVPAAAGSQCKYGQTGVLELISWSIARSGKQLDIGLNIKNVFSKDIAETAIALNVKQRDGSGIGLIGLVDKTPLLAGEKKRLTFRKAYKNEQRAKIFEAQVLTLCVSVAIDASGEHYEFNGTEGF